MNSTILISVLTIVTIFVIYVVWEDFSESKSLWATLLEQLGVSESQVLTGIERLNALGVLYILDQEFVGRVGVAGQGIVFRQNFYDRHEGILFPWERIRNFKLSSDKRFASFSLIRKIGIPIDIRIPWSPGLPQHHLNSDSN